jgi:glutamate-1-semialdehyde 2,1-aminomutase
MAVNQANEGGRSYERSKARHAEAQRYLAGGVSSNFRLGVPPGPLFYDRAQGSRMHDVDGNEYVDYLLGMGPIVLGHSAEAPTRAAEEWLRRGALFGGQGELEIALGRLVCEVVPCAELVRFAGSGSEVVQLAFRLARAYTGKRKIVKFEGHYHGWMDSALISTHPPEDARGPYDAPTAVAMSRGQSPSVLDDVIVLPWNDLELLTSTLEQHANDVAAVIMEPINCNTCTIPPRPGYLEGARELCTRLGIVLIFDEVITGFRVALGGAQAMLGVTPDLATFAKAIANGLPLAMVAGKREIMEELTAGVVHGGTYNASGPVIAAALATLQELARDDGAAYRRMEQVGETLMQGLRAAAERADQPFLAQGYGPIFNTSFTNQRVIHHYRDYADHTDAPRQLRFVEYLMDAGVRITARGAWFTSAAHTDADVQHTLAAAETALRRL